MIWTHGTDEAEQLGGAWTSMWRLAEVGVGQGVMGEGGYNGGYQVKVVE